MDTTNPLIIRNRSLKNSRTAVRLVFITANKPLNFVILIEINVLLLRNVHRIILFINTIYITGDETMIVRAYRKLIKETATLS